MGLIGFIFELAVLGCLAAGIASNDVVGTCDMLVLGRNMGSIGPWRADISGVTDGCVGWSKDETDADVLDDGVGVRVHPDVLWVLQSVPLSFTAWTEVDGC